MGLQRAILSASLLVATALSQEEGGAPAGPPAFRPTVDSMSMIGSGCPIGGAGLVGELIMGVPVFSFTEWDLNLANVDMSEEGAEPVAEKFCLEDIKLGGVPEGYQVRVNTVTVGGWASLGEGTSLEILATTKLGNETAGEGSTSITSEDLEDNTFKIEINPDPEIWSECVGSDGKAPLISLSTSISLHGTVTEDGEVSTGVLGVEPEAQEMDKALTIHFTSTWRECE